MSSWPYLRLALRFLSLFLLASAAVACKCPDVSLEQSVGGADLIFSARVIGSEPPVPFHFTMADKAHFSIKAGMVGWRMVTSQVWKGAIRDTVTVYSDKERASCGYVFELGKRYLIFAKASGPEGSHHPLARDARAGEGWPAGVVFPVPVTDVCSKTRSLEKATSVLKKLGEPMKPRSD